MPFAAELAAALEAAERASAYARREYAAFAPVPDAPASITTHVDRHAQELILTYLREHFPADGVQAEEDTPAAHGALLNSARVWVVDPIDGTRGFAQKNGEFSIMIALRVGPEPVVAVVAEPVTGRVTFATQGGGCFTRLGGEPQRCHVSAASTLADATLTQSHSRPGRPKPLLAALAPGRVVETYSAGIKLAQVARGAADLYVNDYAGFHDWDLCAGQLLVTEAGGVVREFGGGAIEYGGPADGRRGVIACAPGLYAAVRGVVDRVFV